MIMRVLRKELLTLNHNATQLWTNEGNEERLRVKKMDNH